MTWEVESKEVHEPIIMKASLVVFTSTWKFLMRTHSGNYFSVTYYIKHDPNCAEALKCLRSKFKEESEDDIKLIFMKEQRNDLYKKYLGGSLPEYIITK